MKKLMFFFLLFSGMLFAQDVVIEENLEGEGWIVVEPQVKQQEVIVTDSLGNNKLVSVGIPKERFVYGFIKVTSGEVPKDLILEIFKKSPDTIFFKKTNEETLYDEADFWTIKTSQFIHHGGYYNEHTESIDVVSVQESTTEYKNIIFIFAIFMFSIMCALNMRKGEDLSAGFLLMAIIIYTIALGVVTKSWIFFCSLLFLAFILIYIVSVLGFWHDKLKGKKQIQLA